MNVRARLAAIRPGRPGRGRGRARLLRAGLRSRSASCWPSGRASSSRPAGSRAAAAATCPIVGSGSSWIYHAMNSWITQRPAVPDHGQLQPERVQPGRNDFKAGLADCGASEIPYGVQDGSDLRPAAHPWLRVHSRRGRRHHVHVQPEHQRPAGDQPAAVRQDHRRHLHQQDHHVGRPGDQGRQPAADPARDPDHPGRPLRRLGRDRGLHPVDDRDQAERTGPPTARPSAAAPARRPPPIRSSRARR